jgi:uncharacterized protein
MRVVLDTNILISALIAPRGSPDRIYRAWRSGRFILVTSAPLLEEFRRVTRYRALQRYLSRSLAGTMHSELSSLATLVRRLPRVDASPDPDDNLVLATALAGRADYLVTGDKADLLRLGRCESTLIVSASDFLRVLNPRR